MNREHLKEWTMRDEFACKALLIAAMLNDQADRKDKHDQGILPAVLAKEAYRIADAMLERRQL